MKKRIGMAAVILGLVILTATGAEVMAIDSMTNEVVGLAVDERTAGYTERFTKWGSANEAFKFWAHRIRLALDAAQASKRR